MLLMKDSRHLRKRNTTALNEKHHIKDFCFAHFIVDSLLWVPEIHIYLQDTEEKEKMLSNRHY